MNLKGEFVQKKLAVGCEYLYEILCDGCLRSDRGHVRNANERDEMRLLSLLFGEVRSDENAQWV